MDGIKGTTLTPLQQFHGDQGDVYHALKATEADFKGFGEAYFSTVKKGAVKGWKKHRIMHANLIVPVGQVRIVIYDLRPDSPSCEQFQEIILGKDSYQRLSLPPGLWFAFQGIGNDLNLMLNLASIPHDPEECEQLPLQNDIIPFSFD